MKNTMTLALGVGGRDVVITSFSREGKSAFDCVSIMDDNVWQHRYSTVIIIKHAFYMGKQCFSDQITCGNRRILSRPIMVTLTLLGR